MSNHSSVQFSRSVASDSATPWIAARQASLSITNSWSLLRLMSNELVMPSNCLILCRPIFPTFNLSQHQGRFKWVSSLHQAAKVWSFSFNISPSNEYSGLIFFRMDLLDLLEVQGTCKNLLQPHSSKASIFQCSPFFIPQLTSIHDYWKKPYLWIDGPLLAK